MELMTREAVQSIARAVSDPVRLEILGRVGRCPAAELACADLTKAFDLTPATISHHIKELTEAGLIVVRRAGKFNFYSVNRRRWTAYLRELERLIPAR